MADFGNISRYHNIIKTETLMIKDICTKQFFFYINLIQFKCFMVNGFLHIGTKITQHELIITYTTKSRFLCPYKRTRLKLKFPGQIQMQNNDLKNWRYSKLAVIFAYMTLRRIAETHMTFIYKYICIHHSLFFCRYQLCVDQCCMDPITSD